MGRARTGRYDEHQLVAYLLRADQRATIGAIAVLVLVALTHVPVHAQTWVGEKGSLATSLNYEFSRSNSIVEDPDIKIGGEPIVAHVILLGLDYVPIENLELSAQMPFIMTKYQGTGMLFPRHGDYDDGKLHSTLQDFRFNARYQVVENPVGLIPHVGFTIPTTDYETLGYANAGRHLKQLHLGTSIAKFIVPQLYVYARYEFTLSEKYDETPETEAIGQNRSDAALTIGYVLLDGRFEVNLGANARFAHGGIDFVDFNNLPMSVQDNHDPLLKEEFVLVGAGGSYQITEKFSVSLLGRLYVYGRNTRNANSIGVGLAWSIL